MFNAAPYRFAQGTDGFAPPVYGGTLAVEYADVTFEDTSAVDLFTLPLGAVIVGWIVNITTAFDGGGTNLLDIGYSGSAAAYANDLNVSATGQITYGFVASALFGTPLQETVTVTATYIDGAADATEGAATVCVLYVLQPIQLGV